MGKRAGSGSKTKLNSIMGIGQVRDGQDGEKPGNKTTSHHHTPFQYLEGGEGGLVPRTIK